MRNRLLSILLALCMALTLLPGTALAEWADMTGGTGILGQVLDVTTGLPPENVTATLRYDDESGDIIEVTDQCEVDADGKFQFTYYDRGVEFPTGHYTLTFTSPYYMTLIEPIEITGVSGTVIIQKYLTPGGSIFGTVTDAQTGAALAGVSISASSDGEVKRTTSTGEDGSYSFEVESGEYTIEFSKESYQTATLTRAFGPGTEVHIGADDIQLTPEGGGGSEIIASGTCGTYLTWTLDAEGTLYISGTGKMPAYKTISWHYNVKYSPWVDYCTNIKKVIMEDGITAIGTGAFYGCSNLTCVIIPASVIEITTYKHGGAIVATSPFGDCKLLTSAGPIGGNYSIQFGWKDTIPDVLGASSLTNVTIPDGVTRIDNSAFWSCSSLTSVSIPNSVTHIRADAFSYCDSLTDVYYSGSEADWNTITIDSGNDDLLNATIHYNSTGPEITDPETPDKESKITFSNSDLEITLGDEELVQATILYSTLQASDVTWTSSREDVVAIVPDQVSSSLIGSVGGDTWAFATLQALSVGASVITCTTSTGLSNSFKVEVTPVKSKIIIAGINVLDEKDTGEVGASMTFGTYLTEPAWEWTSDNPSVVAFDNKGLASVSRSTNQPNHYYDAIQIYALSSGVANITCKLKDGTEEIYTVRVLSKKEQDMRAAVQEWLRGYEGYISAMDDGLYEKASADVDTNALNRIVNQLEQALEEDYGMEVVCTDSNQKLYIYKAILKMLAEETSYQLAINKISTKNLDFLPIDLVNEIAGGIENTTYRYQEGSVTVELNITSYWGVRFGTATYTSSTGTNYGIIVKSKQESVMKVIEGYGLQLLELDEKLVQQAYKEAYKDLCKTLFGGKSISDMTKTAIANKVSKYVDILKDAGFGDVMDILNTSYNYYQWIKKLENGDFSDLAGYLDGTKDIDFDKFLKGGNSIKDNTAKAAMKLMEKARKKLTELVTGTSGDTLTEMIKNSSMFNCPVYIEVYDSDGTQIGYVGDDDIWYDANLIYIDQDGDTKTVYSFGDELFFRVVGTDYGTLNCTFEEFANGTATGRVNYYDIPLYVDKNVFVELPAENSGKSVVVTAASEQIISDKTIAAYEYEDLSVFIICGSSDTQGGNVYGSGQYVPGDPVKVQATALDGYVFLGWIDSDETLISISPVYEFVARNNMNLIALFAEVDEDADTPTCYVITLSPAGGTLSGSSTMLTDESGKLSSIPTPTRDDYTFDGWYTATVGGTKVTTGTVFTWHTTIYAHWLEVEHNFSSEWSHDENNHWHDCTDPDCNEKSGVEAHKWDEGVETVAPTYEKDGVKTYTCTVCQRTKTETIPKLVSEPKSYTVIVNASPTAGGSVSGGGSYGEGESVTVRAVANSGYRFVCWTKEDGTTASTSATYTFKAEANRTLTAVFEWIGNSGGGGGSTPSNPSYQITVSTVSNGTVTVTPTSAKSGTKITITATPNDGYTVDSVTVTNSSGNSVSVTGNGDGTYTFTMPASAVTVTVTFKAVEYSITISNTTGGTVTSNTTFAKKGDTVTLRSKANVGYISATPTIKDKNVKAVTVVKNANGTYSFTMPEGSVTVTGSYMTPAQMFSDVDDSKWYRNDLAFAVEHGLISGYNGKFDPSTALTRGMMVTLLYNLEVSLEGKPTAPSAAFNDVQAGQYYTDAVAWASYNGIVEGYNNSFNPNGVLDRQQMATILYNYAAYKGYNVSGSADLSGYTDAGLIVSWALAGMRWANSAGIVTGTNSALNPTGTSDRTQGAVLLAKFCREVVGME